jgi:hypothetical protein
MYAKIASVRGIFICDFLSRIRERREDRTKSSTPLNKSLVPDSAMHSSIAGAYCITLAPSTVQRLRGAHDPGNFSGTGVSI